MSESINIKQTLAKSIVKKISIRLLLIIITSSLLSFWYIKNTRTSKEIDFLENYTRLRLQSERHLFEQAVNDVELIRYLYEEQINGIHNQQTILSNIQNFNNLTFLDKDGAIRTKREYFDPQTDAGIFITKGFNLSNELKTDVIFAYNIFRENFNIWTKRYLTTWVVYDGSVSMTLSPKKPTIVYETAADFSDHNEDYYKITDTNNNPQNKGKWTDLYFDPNFKSWMISYTSPLLKKNKKIGAIGVDIYLEELFSRIININLPNSYNFIITDNGQIIAHPSYKRKHENAGEVLNISSSKDKLAKLAFSYIKDKKSLLSQLIKVPQTNTIFSIGLIPETNWYLVTVFPKSYLEKNNQFSLYFVMWSSVLYLFVELLILYITLKTELTFPLQEFIKKIEEIRIGKKEVQFPVERKDELGNLAKTFTTIQKTLTLREQKIQLYTENLEILVQERTNKLEHALKESKLSLDKSIQAAKLATLGEVANGLAHELNSPIMVLKGTAHQIDKGLKQKTLTPERMKHLIDRLKGTTKKVSDSVNNLRIFSRNPSLDQMKDSNLDVIFKSALNICFEKFRFHQIQITISPEDYKIFKVFGKETQLAHALLNLFNNSFDAIINRTEKWIKVEISEDQNFTYIDVSDSGPLIPKEIMSKIFSPFYTTKLGQNRPGLGLSITQKILEEHNGSIQYKEIDNYNHFIIKLPKSSTLS